MMPPSLDQARVVLAAQPFSRLLGAVAGLVVLTAGYTINMLAPVLGDRLLA
jgi:hypothetical protein